MSTAYHTVICIVLWLTISSFFIYFFVYNDCPLGVEEGEITTRLDVKDALWPTVAGHVQAIKVLIDSGIVHLMPILFKSLPIRFGICIFLVFFSEVISARFR